MRIIKIAEKVKCGNRSCSILLDPQGVFFVKYRNQIFCSSFCWKDFEERILKRMKEED